MNRKVPDKQEKYARRLVASLGLPRARVSGGNPLKRSGKTPRGPGRGCDNLGPLRGFKTMHRFAYARVLLTRYPGGTAAC
jgi:hypothetical protein